MRSELKGKQMSEHSGLNIMLLVMLLGIVCAIIASIYLAKGNKKLDAKIALLKKNQQEKNSAQPG